MKAIDSEKLIDALLMARGRHIASKSVSIAEEEYGDSLMHHAAECTIDNTIELIKSGDFKL
mgnify:CR=1 FL=1|tara:strand:- start:42 stop:224 length:183 start_codon:yes stop_codon:yes gene_type:complete